MGWWSPTILGGDPPLDALAVLERAIGWSDPKGGVGGFYCLEDRHIAPLRAALEAHRDTVEQMFVDARWGRDEPFEQVCEDVQAWAAGIMRVGGPMSGRMREIALDAALADPWSREDAERARHVRAFAQAVRDYREGVPTPLPEQGLLSSINERLGDDPAP